jgi:transcriptional regulator with XRE-family HTH domain
VKTAERAEARRLRKLGCSVKEIARLVSVSPSTVSLWVRDISLTDEQHAALLHRNPAHRAQRNGSSANRERGRLRRRSYQLAGRQRAREGDGLFLAGCMLYWGEGAKARTHVSLSNSDSELIRFFARFLRECFDVRDDDLRIRCHLFADHLTGQRMIEQFWLDLLGLPRRCLQASAVNAYSRASKRKRINRLPYGTCNLRVYRTEIVQTIYGAIQELGGFNRPQWLDC